MTVVLTDLFAVGLLTRKGYLVKLRALEVAELEEDFKKGVCIYMHRQGRFLTIIIIIMLISIIIIICA